MIRSLKRHEWSEADQQAWEEAFRKGTLLSRGGAAAHMKPVTRVDLERRYGQFLDHVARVHPEWKLLADPNLLATSACFAIPELIETYLAELQSRVSSVTVYGSISKLRRAAEILNPKRDFMWLRVIERDLGVAIRPAPKFARIIDSHVLILGGLGLMDVTLKEVHLSPMRQAECYRNGLMIALLAVCPLRLKNFASLEVNRQLIQENGSWLISLQAHETKEGRPDLRPLPSFLVPYLETYLRNYRSCFRHAEGQALWVGRRSNRLASNHVAKLVTQTTLALFGKPISPHLFRSCAASAASIYAGNTPHLASGLLNHRSREVTEAHYNRARSSIFAKRFSDLVNNLR